MATEVPQPIIRTTRTFRVSLDLAEKLIEVLDVEGINSAEFFDPLIRAEVENRHKRNFPAIASVRKSREAARKAREGG